MQIRRHENDTIWDINCTGCSDSHCTDLGQRVSRLAAGIADRLDKPIDHINLASLRLGARVPATNDFVGRIDHNRLHVGAAEIDAHDARIAGFHAGHCITITYHPIALHSAPDPALV